MVDYTNLSDVAVDGDVIASKKLKGGQQASDEGDAVLLDASGKVPSGFVDVNVDLSGYVTNTSFTQTLSNYYTKSEVNDLLSGKLDSDALNGYATTSFVTSSLASYVPTARTINGKALTANITLSASDVGAAPKAPWSQEFYGNGSSKTFTYPHDRGTDAVSHDLWKYDTTNSRWELYITDLAVTSTQVTVDFYNAPTSSDRFKIVLR